MIQGIGALIEEASNNVSGLTDNLEKFERLRLLDGLRDYFSGAVAVREVLLALDSFKLTFRVDPRKVELVKNDYVHDFVLEHIRTSGYRARANLKVLELEGITSGLVAPALERLCTEGLLVQGRDGEYTSSPAIWQDDINRFKERVLKLDKEMGRTIDNKSRDYRKIGWDYESLLEKIPVIIDTLLTFNEGKAAEGIKNRLLSETRHFQKHHAGSWTQEMIRQFRIFFRQSIGRLPQELRVEPWP
jgi:hypothetical protein